MYPDTNVLLAVCHLLASYEPATVEAVVSGTGYNRVHVLDALWVLVTVGLVRREAGPPVVFKLIRFADVLDLAARLGRARSALAAKKSSAAGEPRVRSPVGSPSENLSLQAASSAETTRTTQPDGLPGTVGSDDVLMDELSTHSVRNGDEGASSWKMLLPGLKDFGYTDIQAAGILVLAKKTGRSGLWLQCWMDEAKQRGKNPMGYLRRMVEQNADLPPPEKPAACFAAQHRPRRDGEYREGDRVSPERKKQLDSFYDAEHERTRAENIRPTNRISDEEHDRQKEESGWTAMKEQLRHRIEAEAPAEKWGGRVYKRPTEEERAKIAEAKAELEARRKRPGPLPQSPKEGLQDDQETTSGPAPVSWEEEARAAAPGAPTPVAEDAPAEGEPDALAF